MNWEIEKRHKQCDNCSCIFVTGDVCHTAFDYSDDEETGTRQDLCDKCWSDVRSGDQNQGHKKIYWQGIVRIKPPGEKPEVIKKNSAEDMLRNIVHSNDPAKINVSYILGLMLERKKVFIVIDNIIEKETGRKLIVYENSKSGENFIITDPGITPDKVGEVQKHVIELLDGSADNEPAAQNAEKEF
ncbi:hypothetical protein M0R36_05050 [bacterium]|jgi:hypothetical protein|nr:hypothetical protein [bacterium]